MSIFRLLPALAFLLVATPVLAFPPGTQVIEDLSYGPDAAQTLDVYVPDVPSDAPVILMVHGGAWAVGDKRERSVVANKARRFLSQGYVFVSANTRLVPQADPLEQARDVARALAFVQDRAQDWYADPSNIVLMGHSSGGHLVTLLAADPAIAQAEGAGQWRGAVSLDGGGYDIEGIMRSGPPAIYTRAFGSDPSLWRAASPMARLSGDARPMLLVCSTAGRWSCPGARDFAERVRDAGGRAEVLPVGLGHMALNDRLGLDEDYTAAVGAFLASITGRQ